MSMGFVFWEDDPELKREVLRGCARCLRTWYGHVLTDLADVMIVSPSGIGHIQNWDGDERTACGIDATGTDWWWRV